LEGRGSDQCEQRQKPGGNQPARHPKSVSLSRSSFRDHWRSLHRPRRATEGHVAILEASR
jgi:hypothetical protein